MCFRSILVLVSEGFQRSFRRLVAEDFRCVAGVFQGEFGGLIFVPRVLRVSKAIQ